MPRFFFFFSDIGEKTAYLRGENAHHAVKVLRMKIGEEATLCDGDGMDYACRIAEVGEEVLLEVLSKASSQSEAKVAVTLYQGLPKADKMEMIVQKCVELGVVRMIPVQTARSIVKLEKKEAKKIERWQKIAHSAAEQSGRGRIPAVLPPMTFAEALADAKTLSQAMIPYEKEQEHTLKNFLHAFRGDSLGILIGPEGGFSEQEIAQAKEAGVLPVTLGKRILRTETAGMATLAIALYELE